MGRCCQELFHTSSPHLQYNLDYYLSMAEKLVDHGVHALAIKVWADHHTCAAAPRYEVYYS